MIRINAAVCAAIKMNDPAAFSSLVTMRLRASGSALVAFWALLLLLQSFVFTPAMAQTYDLELQARARTIDDLRYLIGPNFYLFIATYWRYMIASCDIFQRQLLFDRDSGLLLNFCPMVTPCPLLFETQSCLIQTAVRAIRLACCSDSVRQDTNEARGRNESQAIQPGHIDDPPSEFDLMAQATCNYMRAMPVPRIIGGSATQRGEFPWVAMLLKDGAYHCVCNIMDENHCLTAAHCFDSATAPASNYEVIGGKYIFDVREDDVGQQRKPVASYIIHGAYDRVTKSNDLAMVRLASPLRWSSYVMPSCLPAPGFLMPRFCVVAGWGEMQGRRNPAVLMKVEMSAYTNEECLKTFTNSASRLPVYVNDKTVCAANGLVGGRDACRGDSGGPLMCMQRSESGAAAYFLYGTVSNGNHCARAGEPGVYMDVREYLAWIQQATRREP